ncbi:LysR family transcriptional regulator [Paenibacillus koleovorans]|uniref:LysR family transcriptional regulator n=1 Tax=Paenibacillus koleovorans TaxID=121608 RepID=UPI000FDAA8B2|nr:LysR family transcriptional regulator [Paenibacillus koleovorans]
MDMTTFQTFREVIRCQSYTKAAEQLGYAQSSVTAQIQKLEQAYGVPLFERHARGMRLTAAGETLWELVRPMLELYQESKEKVGKQTTGPMSVGTIESLAAFYLPPYLQTWQSHFPDKRLSLYPVQESLLVEKVREGEFDFGIWLDQEQTPEHPSLDSVTLRKEELLLIAAPEHPLSSQAIVELNDLAGERFIFPEETCLYRTRFVRLLRDHGISYEVAFELGSLEAIKQCVRFNLGLAVMPRIAVNDELRQGKLVDLAFAHPDLDFSIRLLYHKKKWLSRSHHFFIELLTKGSQSSAPMI